MVDVYLRTAYAQGAEAKAKGWDRINPYGTKKAAKYWYMGYDGEPLQ